MAEAEDATAVLAVHTYGIEDDFNEQFAALRAINPTIAIIDDRCLCMPELEEPNSIADLVLYSTGEKKQVELGAGGIGYPPEACNSLQSRSLLISFHLCILSC